MYLENNCVTDGVILRAYNRTDDVVGPTSLNVECGSAGQRQRQSFVADDDRSGDDECWATRKQQDAAAEARSSVIVSYSSVELSRLPPDMAALLPAIRRPLPADPEPPPPPDWLDVERVRRGQAFARKYMHGLSYSQTLSLLFLFSSPDGLLPLVFTGRSHTPALAHKRYLSTALRVKSWYETDVCDPRSEGYANLRAVRYLHLSVSRRLNAMTADEVRRRSNLEQKLKQSNGGDMLCPLMGTLKADLDAQGPACPVYAKKVERVYLNQMEMVVTQFGFYGLMLLYPHRFAAKTATREELASFAHLWRYFGYMLGIEDAYNLCDGDLDTVRQRARHLVEYFVRPTMLRVNKEWEHMSRSALQGIERFTKMRINFESNMLYFYWLMDVEVPHLVAYVGWKEKMMFNVTKYVMTESHKMPAFGRFVNYVVRRNIENAAAEMKATK